MNRSDRDCKNILIIVNVLLLQFASQIVLLKPRLPTSLLPFKTHEFLFSGIVGITGPLILSCVILRLLLNDSYGPQKGMGKHRVPLFIVGPAFVWVLSLLTVKFA